MDLKPLVSVSWGGAFLHLGRPGSATILLQAWVWWEFTIMSGSADLFCLDGRAGGAPGDDHRLDAAIHIRFLHPDSV